MLTILLALAMTAEPALACSTPVLRLKEIKAGAPLNQQFELRNNSPLPLQIRGVKVSCGCSQWKLSQENVPAGGTAALNVSVNTLTAPEGSWSWTASVAYRIDGEIADRVLTLAIVGTIAREITLSPPGLAFSLESGSATQKVVLKDHRSAPLTVTGVAAGKPFVKVSAAESAAPGEAVFQVTIDESAPPGEHTEHVVVVTNDSLYPELRIPVAIVKRAKSSVKVYPDQLQIEQESDREKLLLRHAEGKPVKIAHCEIDNSAFSVTWSPEEHQTPVVIVKWKTTAKDRGEAVLTVKLSKPAGETLKIPVRWGTR